jgi:quercetin dioxygenase-like cupin family protein
METKARFDEVEWIVRTDAVAVRILTLGPGKGTPWHFHSVVADDVFCLEMPIEVGLRGPDETVRLAPGQRQRIAPGRVHRVVNPAPTPAPYLLVQATGPYDFNKVEDGESR